MSTQRREALGRPPGRLLFGTREGSYMTFLTPRTVGVGCRTPRMIFPERGRESPLIVEVTPRGGRSAPGRGTPGFPWSGTFLGVPDCRGAGRVFFLEVISSIRGGLFSWSVVVSLGGLLGMDP